MTTAVDARGSWLADFRRLEDEGRLPGSSTQRRKAIAAFELAGFPTPDQEAWRFTDIAPIVDTPFTPAEPSGGASIPGVTDGPLKAHQVIVVDGFMQAHPPFVQPYLPGIEVLSLAKQSHPLFGSLADPAASGFTALNAAFWSDGVLVRVPKGMKVTAPIHLLFLSNGGATPRASTPRVLLVAEEGSEVSIVESFVGLGPGVRLTNAVTEVVVGRGSKVDHYRLQREDREAYHVGTLAARVERDGRFRSTAVSVGGAISRVDINVALAGEGADCALHGLYEATGAQLIDHHTTIDHAKPHGTSRELYKGILDGKARAVFNGRVNVRADAQKTDATQSNKNLLLSEGALVHTTPQLEILANDVKCKHGATVGQLDRDVLFYLRSRGIGEIEARRLLIHAFAGEITDGIPLDAVRAQLGGCLVTMMGEEPRREYAV